jgi:hypothetical protein
MVRSECWIGKDLEGNCRGLILRYYPGIRLEELRKSTKTLSQDCPSPGRDSNPGTPEYEAGVLSTRPRRLVIDHVVCLMSSTNQFSQTGHNSSWTTVEPNTAVSDTLGAPGTVNDINDGTEFRFSYWPTSLWRYSPRTGHIFFSLGQSTFSDQYNKTWKV